MSSPTTPNFCSQCGESLSSGDSFCSQCGASVGEETTASTEAFSTGTTGPARHADLRRRVEGFAVDGWDVKRDHGDRVVMINRGIGSIGMHALLLVFTSGVGNLLYGWYSYSVGAERVELHADGTERRPSKGHSSGWNWRSAVAVAAGLTLGVSTALAAVLLLWVTSSLVPTLLAVTFLLTTVASVLFSAQFVPGVESPTTFGRRRRTDEEVVTEPTTPCSACARPVGTGVKRTFTEKRYVAGIPVETLETGENSYCRACANGDPFVGNVADDREKEREREFA
ncbi:zinc ribbon domain-containing protein [Halorussus caseinilyticus]|uniref:Zinc-ribbon domain-containing protein n=1 Tax=Halorussus caseinilyticus TaxID=3034025 RepID=A0ABD5WJ58_9EURY|nr:zinc ribbon domain-containing protein [Halorussus sp. DT72]